MRTHVATAAEPPAPLTPRPGRRDVSSHRRVILAACGHVAALVLCVVFVVSGFVKLNSPFTFLIGLYDWQLIGPPYARFVAAGLPWLELFIGIGLLVPSVRRTAAGLAVVLCVAFLIAQASVLYRGLSVECACFGSGGARVGGYTMLRTAACAALACVALPTARRINHR